jgi:hypothetical protein
MRGETWLEGFGDVGRLPCWLSLLALGVSRMASLLYGSVRDDEELV